MADKLVLVVCLWLRDGDVAEFEAFEREAYRVMARHGGRSERVIRIGKAGTDPDAPFEVHVVTFPHEDALAAYLSAPETLALRPRREAVIARTTILRGRDVPPYTAAPLL